MGASSHHDDFESRFWMSMVAAGAWATLLMCVVGAVYTFAFAEASHRPGLALMVGLTAVGGAVVLRGVPWGRVVVSPWRQWAFFAWTVATIGLITATAAVDGGADSPLALMLFLPVVFVSLAYPLRLVIAGAALAEVAFLLLVVLDGNPSGGTGYVLAFCGALGGCAVLAVWQAGNHEEWRRELGRSSRTDSLTGLLNRRGFAAASDAAFSALDRRNSPVTLLLIDLDLFKAYNDAHGHHAGDALLCWVGEMLGEAVRPTDSVARLGGDEFAVLLPDADLEATDAVAARIEAVLSPRAPHCLGRATAPQDGETFDALYRAADRHLYERKTTQPRGTTDGNASPALEPRRQRRAVPADAVLAGISEAFYVLDGEWRFIYVNEEAERLLGRTVDELLGCPLWDSFPDTGESTYREVLERVSADGIAETFTDFDERSDRVFSIRVSPIPGGVSVHLHDVSDSSRLSELRR